MTTKSLAGTIAVAIVAAVAGNSTALASDPTPSLVLEPPNPTATVILLHQGGWSEPDAAKTQRMIDFPGRAFAAHGYRVVSVDYRAGHAGLQSVKDAVASELANRKTPGPLCLYGESSGGHLALLTAWQMPAVNCVIGIGTPTNFDTFHQEAIGNQVSLGVYEGIIVPIFGPAPFPAKWQPASVAKRINADVVLGSQADDGVVPLQQMDDYAAESPTTRTFVAESAPPSGSTPDTRYLHGTISETGRGQIVGAAQQLIDRQIAEYPVTHWAAASACPHATYRSSRLSSRSFAVSTACLLSQLRTGAGRGALRVATPTAQAARGKKAVSRKRTVRLSLVDAATPARVVAKALASPKGQSIVLSRSARVLSVKVSPARKSTVVLTIR